MQRTTRWTLALVTALLLSPAARPQDPMDLLGLPAQGDKVSVDAHFVPAVAHPGETVTLEISVSVIPGWHVYGSKETTGIPISVTLKDLPTALSRAGELKVPPGQRHEAYGLESWWLAGDFTLKQPLLIAPDAEPGKLDVTAVVDYSACDESRCDPPKQETVETGLDVQAGAPRPELVQSAPSGPGEGGMPPAEPDRNGAAPVPPPAGDLHTGLLAFLLAAIGYGLLTLVMPCTYPMIPITISFFTKQAEKQHKSVTPLALAYGFGIVAIFVLIGLVVGPAIVAFATHPVTNLVIAALFFLFSLVLFGVIDLQPPAFLMRAASGASARGGYVGVFLMGATLVVTSFTCTAPFVGSLLALGATGGTGLTWGQIGHIALGMGVFGLTMAVPFVLLSLVPGRLRALPRSGEWMYTLKVFLGFVELAAAFKFVSNADLAWHWQWLSRELFLLLWAAIFGVAALFLLGLVRLRGTAVEIGPGRLVGALLVAMLSAYCLYGFAGNRLDRLMLAIVPPYSTRVASTEGAENEAAHALIIDDYQAAAELARNQHKLLLLNFTGVT